MRSYKFHSILHDLESRLNSLSTVAAYALQVILAELSFAHFPVALQGAPRTNFISLMRSVRRHPFSLLDIEASTCLVGHTVG